MYLKQVKDVLTLYGGLIILKVIMETKYQNLINYIQEQISDGQLGPGEKVPSENQLSEQFHISRQTVRKAIGTLEEDGLVQRIRGSGTYVSFDRRKNLDKERIAESEPGSVPAPDGQKDTASVFQYLLSRAGGTACIVK